MNTHLQRRLGDLCRSAIAVVGIVLVLTGTGLAQKAQPAAPPQQSSVAPAPPAAVAPPPPGPVGIWIDHTGRGAVEIVQCGPNLCGNIIWLKDQNDKQGKPLRDALNGDKTKRTRSICGLPVLGALKLQRDGSWDAGWIYDPEQGESFDVELRMLKPDLLQVKGYQGFKFLNETFQWRRAGPQPFQRCTVPPVT